MNWADEKIANPMGYQYASLFPRARDALLAYSAIGRHVQLPTNCCPEVAALVSAEFVEIDQNLGLAPIPVQMYGYRVPIPGDLEIDPLITGWVGKPCCESTIISFGFKKTLNVGCGGAFLTNNQGLAQAMEPHGYWPGGDKSELTGLVIIGLNQIHRQREIGFERIAKWDAALGDLLPRIPLEQVMPWRVMRRVPGGKRDAVVRALRAAGIPVGTNYPPLTGSNKWGDEVINFFPEYEERDAAVDIIGAVYG